MGRRDVFDGLADFLRDDFGFLIVAIVVGLLLGWV